MYCDNLMDQFSLEISVCSKNLFLAKRNLDFLTNESGLKEARSKSGLFNVRTKFTWCKTLETFQTTFCGSFHKAAICVKNFSVFRAIEMKHFTDFQ